MIIPKRAGEGKGRERKEDQAEKDLLHVDRNERKGKEMRE